MIYLDYNATSPIRPEAWEAIREAQSWWANPSSTHQRGRYVRGALERARRQIANFLSAPCDGLIFTSGGSEANNLLLKGLLPYVSQVFVSSIEHDSVRNSVPCTLLPVKQDGVLDLEKLEHMLQNGTGSRKVLLSVMLANNETGVVQPIHEVVRLARRYNAWVHTDVVQAVGRIPVSFAELDVDAMTVSAHKLGGLVGVGALILKPEIKLQAQMMGGAQEKGMRAGTENVLGIVGFSAALQACCAQFETSILRDSLEAWIQQDVPGARIIGNIAPRIPNTLCVALPGVSYEKQLMQLDLQGICVSAGAACASAKMRPSHVLSAMGLGEDVVRSAIRVSFGWQSTEQDARTFFEHWRHLAKNTIYQTHQSPVRDREFMTDETRGCL